MLKKFLLISLMLLCLCKCSGIENMLIRFNGKNTEQPNTSIKTKTAAAQTDKETDINKVNNEDFQPKKNKDCIDGISEAKIFQTLDKNRGLAWYNHEEDVNVALFRFPSYLKDKIIIYDGLKIKLPEDQCFVIKDTYTYETKKDKDIKTIPVITFDHKYEKTKQRYIFLEEITAEYCNKNNTELRKAGFKHREQCHCYISIVSSNTYDCLQQADKNEKQKNNICIETFNKAEQEAEHECGKLLDTQKNTTYKKATQKKKL